MASLFSSIKCKPIEVINSKSFEFFLHEKDILIKITSNFKELNFNSKKLTNFSIN